LFPDPKSNLAPEIHAHAGRDCFVALRAPRNDGRRADPPRGHAPDIADAVAERSAAAATIAHGLLASDTPKGPLSLRLPAEALDVLFPRLFAET